MTRTVTGTVVDVDGTPLASSAVTFQLLELFTTAEEVYLPGTQTVTTDAQGQFSTTLGVPDSGTAPWQIGLATGHSYLVNLAAGAAVDLVTLIGASSPAVDPDAVQTLLDAAERFTTTEVSTTYQVLDTDEYVEASGTFTVTLRAASLAGDSLIIDNVGTGVITLAPSGTDTIDGAAASLTIYAGGTYGLIVKAAGAWRAVGGG
jgi:hypothetical protein